jgi:hypothetical protein
LILLLNICIKEKNETKIKEKNVSGLADLNPLFFKVSLIANPLTAMARKKVR